ncbi:MAG TPA: hypothetical protein EYH34_08720, partial [Planctomycetes bacterium]|nr:hypothetical protein [Planctomycetota bacterium]
MCSSSPLSSKASVSADSVMLGASFLVCVCSVKSAGQTERPQRRRRPPLDSPGVERNPSHKRCQHARRPRRKFLDGQRFRRYPRRHSTETRAAQEDAMLAVTYLGVTYVDWLVIIVYLVGITVLGTWAVRKVKDSTSFFISDRKFGSWMMIFFNFGTGTHSDQAVSVSAQTYRVGASGIWYQLLWIFSTPLYWVIAPLFRRMRAVTTSDYFEARYNQSVGVLYAVVAIMNLVVN